MSRRSLNSVFVFFATFCSALGISGAQAGTPKIACRDPVYDFGTAVNTGKIEHVFVIWNDGDAPLEIGNLRACCGASMRNQCASRRHRKTAEVGEPLGQAT